MSRKNIADIYENKVLVEMDVGGVVGSSPITGGGLDNEDDYAKGDNRIPYVMGRIQSRTGKVKQKAKKVPRKKRFNELF